MVLIPYGTRYTATVTGSIPKLVECENCQQAYVYQVERSASASQIGVFSVDSEGCSQRASQGAHEGLREELDLAIDPVACPECGWLQAEMCRVLKQRRRNFTLVIALPIALIILIWGIVLFRDSPRQGGAILALGGMVAVGGTLLGVTLSYLHDPNKLHPGIGGKNQQVASRSEGRTKAAFDAEIAQTNNEFLRRFHHALLQSMLQMSVASSSNGDAKLACVSDIYRRVAGAELAFDELQREALRAAGGRLELMRLLRELSNELNDDGKDMFLKAGASVAFADGNLDQNEWNVLGEVAQALGFTQQRFDAVMRQMQGR